MGATLPNPITKVFSPNGLSDAFYTQQGDNNAQPGGCLTLQNVVPDRHTRGVYAPRPAYSQLFDASLAPGLTITAPGAVTFSTAPLSGAALTWTDDNTPTPQSLGTGDGTTAYFAFIKNGNPYQPVNAKVYMDNWQGNQLQYTSARTNVCTYNTSTSGFSVANFTLGADATAGPDGGAAVYGQEGVSGGSVYQISTNAGAGTVSIGDYFTFVVDFHLTAGYSHNENLIQIAFENMGVISGFTPYANIDISLNTVISSGPGVTAAFVGALPNGFSRFSFVVGAATASSSSGPFIVVEPNNGGTIPGDGSTKLYVRPDIKKTKTVSSWIKNTTSSSVSVTDYALTNTSVGTTIGNISAIYTLGSLTYGMMLGNNVGTYFDCPFCYDADTASFITISGITTSNVPKSTGYPNGSGAGGVVAADWVAPQMQLVGSKIVVTHYGFAGTGNYVGWIDVSSPSSPAWSAGNLSGALSFSSPPVAVTQFNGRAYYAVGGNVTSNNVIFSDSLDPTTATNSTQVLTIGDNQIVTGFGQQPYNSTSTGGIIQSILAFKNNSIIQITGDATTSNLAVNTISYGIGTKAPQTIASTPLGVMFMAADGIRYVDLYGNISQPLPSLRNPFMNCNVLSATSFPSTACASYNSSMYRISLYSTDILGNLSRQEYVYDLEYGWHGPHVYDGNTTGIALIAPYQADFLTVTRPLVPSTSGKNSALCTETNLDPNPTNSFIESGATLTWQVTSCADRAPPVSVLQLQNATLAYNPGASAGDVAISFLPTPTGVNQSANQTASATVTLSYSALGSLWGSVTWGAFLWGGSAQQNMTEATVPLPNPVVYKGLQIQISGTAALNQRLGPVSYRTSLVPSTNTDLTA